MKIALITAISLILIIFIPVSFRISKDINKKLNHPNSYAIQNIATNNCLRVHDANPADDTEIISYSNNNWECITWELIELQKNIYLLKNLYTEKTFQPLKNEGGSKLIQKPLGGDSLKYWEFIKTSGDNLRIRLKGTELYLTITSQDDNSLIILQTKKESQSQLWKLIKQSPWI